MAYFDHDYVSNSDLKAIMQRAEQKRAEPENLKQIFEAGTLNHHALLEPHKAKQWLNDKIKNAFFDEEIEEAKKAYDLACKMAKTVLADKMCQNLIMMPDFRREHEWYRAKMFGVNGVRCKTDGDSRMMSTIFEYKGLAVTTENGFDSAIENHDYDQSAHFYLNVVGYKNYLIVGVSKTKPDKLFKRLITREHRWYATGGLKVQRSFKTWKDFGFV